MRRGGRSCRPVATMPSSATPPAPRAKMSVRRPLVLLILWAVILIASGDDNEGNTQSPLPESSTTEIAEGTESTSESPSKPNDTDLQNKTKGAGKGAGPGPGRFRLHTRALPWLGALDACRRAGQQLAVPRTAAEALALGRLLANAVANDSALWDTPMRDALHVGLNDIAREGRWITVHGEPLSAQGYGVWLSAGAANSPQRNCGALLADDGRLVAQRCNASLAYACEPLPTPAPAGKGDGYHAVGGFAMYKLHTKARPWARASAACVHEGAALVTPETAREAGLLAGMMTAARRQLRQSGVFIGANDLAEEGDWRHYDGTKLRETGYNSWAPGEPSGARAENCGTLLSDGHLADAPCSEPRAFYCKRPAAVAGAGAEAERGSDGYAEVEGVGRCRVHLEGRDWAAALLTCARDNATLAVGNSSQEALALATLFRNARAALKDDYDSNYMHVGAITFAGDAHAVTVSGQRLGQVDWYYHYSYYRPEEGNDNCVRMDTSGTHHYNSCDTKHAFICRKSS